MDSVHHLAEELTNIKFLNCYQPGKTLNTNVIDEGGYEKERFSDITTKQLEILVQDILRKEINLNDEFQRKR